MYTPIVRGSESVRDGRLEEHTPTKYPQNDDNSYKNGCYQMCTRTILAPARRPVTCGNVGLDNIIINIISLIYADAVSCQDTALARDPSLFLAEASENLLLATL